MYIYIYIYIYIICLYKKIYKKYPLINQSISDNNRRELVIITQ